MWKTNSNWSKTIIVNKPINSKLPRSRRDQLRPDSAFEISALNVNHLTFGAFAGRVIEHGSSWRFDKFMAVFIFDILVIVAFVIRLDQFVISGILTRSRWIQFLFGSLQSSKVWQWIRKKCFSCDVMGFETYVNVNSRQTALPRSLTWNDWRSFSTAESKFCMQSLPQRPSRRTIR